MSTRQKGDTMHATDIIGYTFQADIYCADCVVPAMVGGFASEYGMVPETQLDRLASLAEIDRYDESTFDSDDFPKVVFVSDASETDYCASCHSPLI